MRNDLATDLSRERYVVEVDGIAKAEYRDGRLFALRPKRDRRQVALLGSHRQSREALDIDHPELVSSCWASQEAD
jgi:hypothetical protein